MTGHMGNTAAPARRRAADGLEGDRRAERENPIRDRAPNDVWCIDYKGQFRLGTGDYCYPLTLTDQFSRYILSVEAMDAIRMDGKSWLFPDVLLAKGSLGGAG